MKLKISGILFFCLLSVCVVAQTNDSLFVLDVNNGWMIRHTAHKGETVFSIARKYHVPPAILADKNGLTYQSALTENMIVNVPIGAYNQLREKPLHMEDARALFYKAAAKDNLYRLSKNSGVSQNILSQWNGLNDTYVKAGQVLFVGWVLYDATNSAVNNGGVVTNTKHNIVVTTEIGYGALPPKSLTQPPQETPASHDNITPQTQNTNVSNAGSKNKNGAMPTIKRDTLRKQVFDTVVAETNEERLYKQQTNNEINSNTEKGSVVFIDMKNSGTKNVFYAFHDNTPRGIIIKVYNPSSQKTIYVKVIGPVPPTKQFYNCIMGISSAAKEALGVSENKTWCELTYGLL